MSQDQPLSWQLNAQPAYIPVSHKGTVVGFCQPLYAKQIIESLNYIETLQQALELACYDLVAREGGSSDRVDERVQDYLSKVIRPPSGSALIGLMLKGRQRDLDLNDEEFAKFCDSYRLSRKELRNICSGEDIETPQLSPLARILGISLDDLINTWQGDEA